MFIISTLLFTVPVFSQRPETGLWLSIQLPVTINVKWQWHNDGGYRTLGYSTSAIQYLFRTGIRYIFNKKWNVATGVAFFANRTTFLKENDEFTKEFRIWEEVNFKTEIKDKTSILTRLRSEQRSFAATSTNSSYYANRYRIKLQVQQKLSGKWAFQLADEYMQQHTNNNWSFDQNRLITSCTFFLNTHTQLQLGYMWLLWPKQSSQHILTTGFQKNIFIHEKM